MQDGAQTQISDLYIPSQLIAAASAAAAAVVGDNVMLTVATSDMVVGPTRLLFPRAPGGMGEVRSSRVSAAAAAAAALCVCCCCGAQLWSQLQLSRLAGIRV
jgi:hypothetical protein